MTDLNNQVMDVTREYMLSKLRDETKDLMCGDTIAARMMGGKPVDDETREGIYKLIDSMTDEEFEDFYIEAHKDDTEFE